MRPVRTLSLALSLVAAGTEPAFAQKHTSLIAGGGAVWLDASGLGTAPAFTARVSDELGNNLVIEGSLLYARPERQSRRSTFLAPEVQLQYHFPAGRFAPYIGAGVGAARDSAPGAARDWGATASLAVGSRASFNDRAGLFGELRVRRTAWDAAETTVDVMGGLVVRLGR